MRKLARKNQRTERSYHEALYQAGSWDKKRRVIIKAEVTHQFDRELRDNPR